MGQNEEPAKGAKAKAKKAPKTSWFAGLKSEFGKITWLDRDSVIRQTIAVIAISVLLALIIALIDWIIQYGVDFLIQLSL